MFAHKSYQIIAGIVLAGILAGIFSLGYNMAPAGSSLETFFFALGGKMPDGLIQFATFACFFICIFGMYDIRKKMQREEQAFSARLLPETEQYVLYAEDVNRIKLETIETEKRIGAGMLTDLIKQATTKFRSNHSPAESLAMVETVSTMQRQHLEKEFWLMQICQTLIPAFGFLGTVWGMAAAILNMGQVKPVVSTAAGAAGQAAAGIQPDDIQVLIENLGTAFFTTIVSIVLGIVVSILGKQLESRADGLHHGIKKYVVENLINRIHA